MNYSYSDLESRLIDYCLINNFTLVYYFQFIESPDNIVKEKSTSDQKICQDLVCLGHPIYSRRHYHRGGRTHPTTKLTANSRTPKSPTPRRHVSRIPPERANYESYSSTTKLVYDAFSAEFAFLSLQSI